MTKKKKIKNSENISIIDLNSPIFDVDSLSKYEILSYVYHSKLNSIDKNQSSTKYVIYDNLETCIYCSGEHLHYECPTAICKKCGKQGHYYKKCTEKNSTKKTILCRKCNYGSHSEFDCPFIFRKYNINLVKPIIKTCGRCAGSHFSDDCDQSLEVNRFSIFSDKFLKYLNNQVKKK